nr:hypothetical protein BaRGS_021350 [Batillaria attramentaria]
MNVIKACKRNGVKNLIFVSSIDVLIGYKDIINEYNILHTLVIRPVTMYGELDNRYLASMLRLALANYVPEKYAKAMMVVLKVILWLLSPFIAYNPHFSYELVHYLCHTYTFSDKRARRELGYQPIYPTANSWQRTFAYFDEKFKVALVDFLSKNVIE